MDVLIKFDNKTMTGYDLRFIRTTKYHDAVDCVLLEYRNNIPTEITSAVTIKDFKNRYTISLEVIANQLTFKSPFLNSEIILKTNINPNNSGGFGILYNGGSQTMINEITTEWK